MNWLTWLLAGSAAFITTMLRGFQNKSVAAGYKGMAFGVGALMACADGLVIVMVAKSGFEVLPFSALGAGLGWVCGMVLHDMMTAERRAEAQRRKKAKRQERIRKILEEQLNSRK